MMIAISYFLSPVGYLRLEADNDGLQSLLLNSPPADELAVLALHIQFLSWLISNCMSIFLVLVMTSPCH